MTQSVVITNSIPETCLEARWEVAPYPTDPEHYHWIRVEPAIFEGNQVNCWVSIDTRPLMAGKTYHRKIFLYANTLAKTYTLNLQIHTAPLATSSTFLNQGLLLLFWLFSLGWSWVLGWVVLVMGTIAGLPALTGSGAMLGIALGLELAAWMMHTAGWQTGPGASTLAALLVAVVAIASIFSGDLSTTGSMITVGAIAGVIGGAIAGIALGSTTEQLISQGTPKPMATGISLLVVLFGSSLGLNLTLGFANSLALTLLIVSSVLTLIVLVLAYLKQANTRFGYRRAERHLIKP